MKIVVSVGTIQYPFERMTAVVRLLQRRYPNISFYIQSGHTPGLETIKGVEGVDFVEQRILRNKMKEADLLLIHGGEGSILDSIESNDLLPIIFPRDPKYNEHVDKYQLEVAREVVKRGLGVCGFSVSEIFNLVSNTVIQRKINSKRSLGKSTKYLRNQVLINLLNEIK